MTTHTETEAETNANILIADVGATNARFALATQNSAHFSRAQTLQCEDFSNIEFAIDHYLETHSISQLRGMTLAVAGPIVNGSVKFLNNNWHLNQDHLRSHFTTDHVWLLNDWEAIAYSLRSLTQNSLIHLGGPRFSIDGSEKRFVYGALGPGSGLGVTGLCGEGSTAVPLVTEGGHVGFAPESDLQRQILEFLQSKFDNRVSRERLLSGPGLVNIHQALCAINDVPLVDSTPSQIAELGIKEANTKTEFLFAQTMSLFFEILGQVAGDVALDMGASNGVFIGGGIAQRYPEQLLNSRFRAGFENKGRHRDLMEQIPTQLITHKNPGLVGASVYARQRMSPLFS